MNKFKPGDRVKDITTSNPVETGTVTRYSENSEPYVLWDNGPSALAELWTYDEMLELIGEEGNSMYKFIDETVVDTNVEIIGKSGSFSTKKNKAYVYYEFGLDGVKYVELGISNQGFRVEDLEQLKAFIEFSINKLKAAEATQE